MDVRFYILFDYMCNPFPPISLDNRGSTVSPIILLSFSSEDWFAFSVNLAQDSFQSL